MLLPERVCIDVLSTFKLRNLLVAVKAKIRADIIKSSTSSRRNYNESWKVEISSDFLICTDEEFLFLKVFFQIRIIYITIINFTRMMIVCTVRIRITLHFTELIGNLYTHILQFSHRVTYIFLIITVSTMILFGIS